jgi:hypothetical protein
MNGFATEVTGWLFIAAAAWLAAFGIVVLTSGVT